MSMTEHAASSTPRLTPDEIVSEIFRIQNERHPNADPGDISIDIQDDMPMVTITQTSLGKSLGQPFAPFIAGSSIQETLENALEVVRRG